VVQSAYSATAQIHAFRPIITKPHMDGGLWALILTQPNKKNTEQNNILQYRPSPSFLDQKRAFFFYIKK
jgi:hypothetical protein